MFPFVGFILQYEANTNYCIVYGSLTVCGWRELGIVQTGPLLVIAFVRSDVCCLLTQFQFWTVWKLFKIYLNRCDCVLCAFDLPENRMPTYRLPTTTKNVLYVSASNWKIKLFSQQATHGNNFRFNIVHMLEHCLVMSVSPIVSIALAGWCFFFCLAKTNALSCVHGAPWFQSFGVWFVLLLFLSSMAKTISIVFPFHSIYISVSHFKNQFCSKTTQKIIENVLHLQNEWIVIIIRFLVVTVSVYIIVVFLICCCCHL